MSLVMIADQTDELADLHETDAMLRNTTKPIATWAFNQENMERIFRMCAAVAGGKEKLKEKPFLIVYSEPTTPLTHTKNALEKLMVAAEYGIPCVYTSGIIMGAAGPTTLAGCLTVGYAESFTGLVIHQLPSGYENHAGALRYAGRKHDGNRFQRNCQIYRPTRI